MVTRAAADASPVEAQSGLPAWARADLPVPPSPRGLGWIAAVGPGVIVLGISIGSGVRIRKFKSGGVRS